MKKYYLIVPLAIILIAYFWINENESPPVLEVEASEKINLLELEGSIPKLEREPSLVGIDDDQNGIRDDIDAYIDIHYADPALHSAADQLAQALQNTLLVDVTDIYAIKSTNRKLSEADHCIYSRFDGTNNTKQPAQVSQELEAITTNTKQRLLAYLAFAKALDGTSWSIPEGDTCE